MAENDIIDLNVNVYVPENIQGVIPYQDEPEYSDSSSNESENTETDDDFEDHYNDRMGNNDWCKCKKCNISLLQNR